MYVCGLKSKLYCPEFITLINDYHVVTCLETKLDDLDVVNIDNYECVRKDRIQKVIRRSGGIAVLVNKHIASYFEYIDSDCEYVLWFKLSKVLLNIGEDIYMGAVYLPPINSNYC